MTGSLIRDLRRKLGLTQRELAALLGVERQTISEWERCDSKRVRARGLPMEILIVAKGFPQDRESKRELARRMREGKPLDALKLVLDRAETAILVTS